jgi:hypothetical protein
MQQQNLAVEVHIEVKPFFKAFQASRLASSDKGVWHGVSKVVARRPQAAHPADSHP